MISVLNLLADLPAARDGEVTQTLLAGRGFRVERIVSRGQSSPEAFWYDQDDAEWVMLLRGAARLAIQGEVGERALGPGDAIFLPARCRHRVAWTAPDEPTVWLALFVSAGLALDAAWPAGGDAEGEER